MRALLAVVVLLVFAAAAMAERRVALVVGNGGYEHSTRLKNPANDADDVEAALRDIGFDVIKAKDVGIAGFRAVVAEFARKARNSDVTLFYYSGHGMQWDGQNMLVPTDATFENADIVPFEVLPLYEVQNALALAGKAKILILDACRDNDAERALKTALAEETGTRSTALERGLTKLQATRGQVVVFATQANQTASDYFDDSSRNSPFTHAFLETIKEPGVEIGRTFRKVAARVNALTRGAQLPETSISLLGDFYFVPETRDGGDTATTNAETSTGGEPEGSGIQAPTPTFDQWKQKQLASVSSATRNATLADELTIVSWGGQYTRSQVMAYDRPYLEQNPGLTISNVDKAADARWRLRDMAKSGKIEWDVVDVIAADGISLCDQGLALEINADRDLAPAPDGTPAWQDFGPFLISPCFIPQIAYSMTVGYRNDAFNRKPTSICALFDTAGFPGRRALEDRPDSNLIWALVCDGVEPSRVYQVLETNAGIDRALAKLDTIKDQVTWWKAGAETPQLLADKQVVMGSTWNGRLFNLIEVEKQPVSMLWHSQIIDLDGWIIPSGLSPERTARALDYVRFATDTQRLADQTKYIAYGPARSSSLPLVGQHAELGIDMKAHLPTNPAHLRNAFLFNTEWWAEHRDRLDARFRKWRGS